MEPKLQVGAGHRSQTKKEDEPWPVDARPALVPHGDNECHWNNPEGSSQLDGGADG